MKPEVALMNGMMRMLTPLLVMPVWGMLPPNAGGAGDTDAAGAGDGGRRRVPKKS